MTKDFPTLGKIERYSDRLDALIDPDTAIKQLADGFKWTEGPTWDSKRDRLLFSDIPNNRIHSWNSEVGLETVIDPAGNPHGAADEHAAPGTNGLFYQPANDSLLICNQDGRSVDRMDFADKSRTSLADQFEGDKFNSPNDVIRASDGTIFFTDPPYGLKDGDDSRGRQMSIKGVYRLSIDGKVTRLVSDMSFPNGLALSPDERHLYISQSDPHAPVLRRFALNGDGSVSGGDIWLDTASELNDQNPGLPDGMAVDQGGNVFATGPGGVFIVAPDGEILGRIHTGKATANCAFGDDGSILYMTATDTLLRIQTKTKGVFF